MIRNRRPTRDEKGPKMTDLFAAVDLGATSGRVIAGRLRKGRFHLREVDRFTTPTMTLDGHAHWDAHALFAHILAGLGRASALGRLRGVGVDTWGVDYARLTPLGAQVEPPFHYRDPRTSGAPASFFADFPAERLYAEAGLQVMDFNTIFQLVSQADDPSWPDVASCLFLPDLFTYLLSGAQVTELTIASTSGLLDVARRAWSPTILSHLRDRYGLDPSRLFPAIVEPGTVVGAVHPELLDGQIPVVAVGAHDTASAVAAVPASTPRFAYISSGTWSLVGVELDHPILTEESRQADFTNELGVDSTVRYLRNVMGLWVLTQSLAHWHTHGFDVDLPSLLDGARRLPALTTVVDMEDQRLLPPGDMPSRLAEMARETGQHVPETPAEFTRCILDSLALDYRRVIRLAQELSGVEVDTIHIVGGGCQNELLNQLTAEATGLPVIAGPAEATALGNLAVQARAVGAVTGDLWDVRAVCRASSEVRTYTPGALGLSSLRWDEAERRAFRR